MDWSLILNSQTEPLLIAAGLGLLIGFEREVSGKSPGIRTFALISIGSCLFTLLSVSGAGPNQFADPTRIAAQVLTGIGFLGAGAIFRSRMGVEGLTTAALMWVTAAIGMACGFQELKLAFSTTVITVFIVAVIGFIRKIVQFGLRKYRVADTSADN